MIEYRCDHIHLKSTYVEETAKWYCDIFDAEITFEGYFKGSKVVYFNINGMDFIVFGKLDGEKEPITASLRPMYGNDHFGFEVNNMEEAIESLKNKDVNILEGPINVRKGLKIAYIEGPDKVRIELSERNQ
ncbi:hypothetical protein GM661_16605 [Iocasia frigidifontis]|uniref:VOC domain-containing protein n=1 Tax=Iocasia fonsfrigidae TaxID=2682810 RepID=A0A8A7KIN4_9FIRM|nr:VOC family protein [Iocasia fonsfrigidae]QTL99449.1 hypothetical protein GM661_16605 [Iocasia fonsfrigidae]